MNLMVLKQENENLILSKISMFISGICMGNVGIFITLLSNYPIYTIVLLRGIFGSIFLTIYMGITKSLSKDFLKMSFKSNWKYLILLGISNPIVIFLYFLNIVISNYSIAAFLLYTSGIFLLLILILTRKEKVSIVNILSFFLAVTGVAIIMEFWRGNLILPCITIGIFSGLSLGLMIFIKKQIYKNRSKNNLLIGPKGNFDTFLSWYTTLLLMFIFLPFGFNDLFKLTLSDIIISLFLGLIPTALAFTLYNVGVKKDKGGNIVILSYFEPIIATINTAIFLQKLSVFTIIGGLLIIFANIIILIYSK